MQKVKKLIKNTVIASFVGIMVAGGGAAVMAQPAQALDCAILDCSKADSKDGVYELLKWVLRIMTALVGVAAVGGVIWAGIMYMTAGDKTDQVKKAKTIIIDVVIGIIAYGLMFVFLNWLVPGGVFG